jgi:hypothetical protein
MVDIQNNISEEEESGESSSIKVVVPISFKDAQVSLKTLHIYLQQRSKDVMSSIKSLKTLEKEIEMLHSTTSHQINIDSFF